MNNGIKTWAARTISTTATIVSIACCLPQSAMCLDSMEQVASNIVVQMQHPNFDVLENEITKIVEFLEESKDPVADGYRFLQSLLDQMNAQTGYSFTMFQFLQQIKENLHLVQIPGVDEADLLEAIQMLEDYSMDHQSNNHWAGSGFHQQSLVKEKSRLSGSKIFIISLITAAAVTICIVQPAAIPVVLEGAVTVGCAAIEKKNKKKSF